VLYLQNKDEQNASGEEHQQRYKQLFFRNPKSNLRALRNTTNKKGSGSTECKPQRLTIIWL